jgi:hypothetical protein
VPATQPEAQYHRGVLQAAGLSSMARPRRPRRPLVRFHFRGSAQRYTARLADAGSTHLLPLRREGPYRSTTHDPCQAITAVLLALIYLSVGRDWSAAPSLSHAEPSVAERSILRKSISCSRGSSPPLVTLPVLSIDPPAMVTAQLPGHSPGFYSSTLLLRRSRPRPTLPLLPLSFGRVEQCGPCLLRPIRYPWHGLAACSIFGCGSVCAWLFPLLCQCHSVSLSSCLRLVRTACACGRRIFVHVRTCTESGHGHAGGAAARRSCTWE